MIGAGGHARALLDVLRAAGWADPVAILDRDPGARVLGLAVTGSDADLPGLFAEGVRAAVVAIGDNTLRERIGVRLREQGFALPALVHPSAIVAGSATLGAGVALLPRVVVGAGACIGEFAILNSGSIAEHDAQIGTAAHLAPGVVVAGDVFVGARSLVGVGACVRPGIRIGADCIVGAGAAVVADVPAGASVMGVPARARA